MCLQVSPNTQRWAEFWLPTWEMLSVSESWPVPGTHKESAPFLHPSQGLVSLLHLGVDGVQVVLNPVDLLRLGVEHVQGVLSRGLALKTLPQTSVIRSLARDHLIHHGHHPPGGLQRGVCHGVGLGLESLKICHPLLRHFLVDNCEQKQRRTKVEVEILIYQTKTPTCTVTVSEHCTALI